MNAERPAVAHLVTPYLFTTGAWIHAQIIHNPRFRALVMTQATENLDVFPFSPVHDFSAERRGLKGIPYTLSKYAFGRFPHGPYSRTARREEVTLLHAHQGWEGARTVHLRRILGIPMVTSFYGRDAWMLPRKPYWRALYKRLFRDGDLFLAEGRQMAARLQAIGAPADRIRVMHLGVDVGRIPFAERKPGPKGEITALIAASFREKKGIPYALEAVARIAGRWPGLRIRIIGDGPLRSQIESRIARPDLSGRVELLGYCRYPTYLAELAAAHLLLSPSVTASDGDCEGGAPVCILDAQAAGLPVVATMHCDIPEVTVPDQSALLADERDVEGLIQHLVRLLEHPESWGEMGRVGRAHVEAEFNIVRQGERMAELYEELLRKNLS